MGQARKPNVAAEAPTLHVDAVAWAAMLAIEKPTRGVYNVAEPKRLSLSTGKVSREVASIQAFD
jgi:hypothetical protein